MKQLFLALFFLAVASLASGQTIQYQTNQSDQDYVWEFDTTSVNETGELFQLGSSNATLTGFDVNVASFQDFGLASNYSVSDVHLLVTVFSGYQLTYNDAGPEFSNPAESVLYDLPMQFVNDHAYAFTGTASNPYFTLPTPVPVSGNLVGIQFIWLGLESGTYQPIAIQIPFDMTNAPSVGNNGLSWSGYQPEFIASSGTDSSTSMLQNQGYSGGLDNLDLTLYGAAAPEPATMGLLAVGALALMRRRRG